MSIDQQIEYQKLMSERRELEMENVALRCNNLVMKEVVGDRLPFKPAAG